MKCSDDDSKAPLDISSIANFNRDKYLEEVDNSMILPEKSGRRGAETYEREEFSSSQRASYRVSVM